MEETWKKTKKIKNRKVVKTQIIHLRVTEKEAERYKKQADELQISVSELVRRTMENRPPIVISGYSENVRKLISTISSIGNFQVKLNDNMAGILALQAAGEIGSIPKEEIVKIARKRYMELKTSRNELLQNIQEMKRLILELKKEVDRDGTSKDSG